MYWLQISRGTLVGKRWQTYSKAVHKVRW